MKSLTSLFTFEMADKKNDLKKKMSSVNKALHGLDLEYLDDELRTIQRKFNYAFKAKTLNEVTNGNVLPIFNPEMVIPSFVPSFLKLMDNDVVAVVNLGNHGAFNRNEVFTIDPRTLFALLQTGTFMRETFLNWNKVSMNSVIVKNGAMIYSKLFAKLMDKVFAINLDPIRSDIVRYLAAKFFLLFHMERSDGENTRSIAYSAVVNGTTRNTVLSSDDDFPSNAYDSINNFASALSSIQGLGRMSTRLLFKEWMSMYGESSILALEYFPIFCHMVFSSMIGAKLVKDFAIEPVAPKETVELYNEMARILR